jgi:multiphosphoryl transfer protein
MMPNLRVDLFSPITGVPIPIEMVPDPVFAERIVGDGIALDPIGSELVAPCDGVVSVVHRARHAVTIAHPSGLEVLMHVGLDTVKLAGRGFEALVSEQQQVHKGQPLLRFEADKVAQEARSLLTMLVVTAGERALQLEHAELGAGRAVCAGQDRLFTVTVQEGSSETSAQVQPAPQAPSSAAGHETLLAPCEATIEVRNPSGLHARPAAVLVALARGYSSQLELVTATRRASARSLVNLLALGLGPGDKVRVIARGVDAQQAIEAVEQAFASGLGDDLSAAAATHTPSPAPQPTSSPTSPSPGPPPRPYVGVPAAPGIAVGTIYQHQTGPLTPSEAGQGPEVEFPRLQAALDRARAALLALIGSMQAQGQGAHGAVFEAHRELLDDPELHAAAASWLHQGKSAAWAWQHACEAQARVLETLPNALLAGRAQDLRDVGRRVVVAVDGEARGAEILPPASILLADDLTPSETATLDRSRVLGLATVLGGSTSHVSILARSFGLPAVVALDPRIRTLASGTVAVLDGTRGTLLDAPSPDELACAEAARDALASRRADDQAAAREPARTQDGRHIEVAANLDEVGDLERLLELGCDGVGLLRSEFLFLGRSKPPSEDEQAALYDRVATSLGDGRKLIVRTLDIGGDKPLPYLSQAPEANPFLGERGLRLSLRQPELLRTQFRALLACAHHSNLHVMVPMVTTIEEFRHAKAMFEAERLALSAPDVPLGIMIEVPAAALCARSLAREADFFSIGTNDLTQYTLAIDRGHPGLASMADGLHPAVLALIAQTVEGAHAHGRWVGVCGGLAGEAAALPLLVGLGVDELSVAAPLVATVKAAVRALDAQACRVLAERALLEESAQAVRTLVEEHA